MSGKPAARLSDPTACPIPGHGVNPIAAGSSDVLFDGLPAARQGDPSACGGAMVANVIPNVLINGKPAVVVGSVGSHGNVVVGGSGTVVIGDQFLPAVFLPPAEIPNTRCFSQAFLVVDSQSGKPLANRPCIISVDGRKATRVTNSMGVIDVEASSDDSEIEIHVLFLSPARELTEFSEVNE